MPARDGGYDRLGVENVVGQKMVLSHSWRRAEYFVELLPAVKDQVRRLGCQAGVIPLEIASAVALEIQLSFWPSPSRLGNQAANRR